MTGLIAGLFVGAAMLCCAWAAYLGGRARERLRVQGLIRAELRQLRAIDEQNPAEQIEAVHPWSPMAAVLQATRYAARPIKVRMMALVEDVRLGVKPKGGS